MVFCCCVEIPMVVFPVVLGAATCVCCLFGYAVTQAAPQEDEKKQAKESKRKETPPANYIVDRVLHFVRQFLIHKQLTGIPLPEIYKEFTKKIAGLETKGYIKAWNGLLTNLATIKRTGEFSVNSDLAENEYKLFGSLGLDELTAKYDYEAKYVKIGPSGKVNAKVGENSVYFMIRCQMNSLSKIHINAFDIKIEKFDNIVVDATGLGIGLNWLASTVASTKVNNMKTDIIKLAEDVIRTAINSKLNELDWTIPINV